MTAQRPWTAVVAVLGAVAVAAAWPVTAYAGSPLLLPGLVVAVVVTALVMWRPEFGLALALVLVPLLQLRVGAATPIKVLLPALAGGILAYGLVTVRKTRAEYPSWLIVGIVALLVSAIASSLRAIDPSAAVDKVFLLLTAVFLFFAVLQICRNERQLVTVVAGALVGLAIASAHGILQNFTGAGKTTFVVDGEYLVRVQGAFSHPNFYGGYLALLIPVAGAVVLTRSAPTPLRWLGVVAIALAIPALVFSYSRGSMSGLVIGSLLWLALVRPRVAPIVAIAVAVGAIAFAPASLRARFSADEQTSYTAEVRRDIWAAALDIYAEYPVLGAGVNNFPQAYAELPTTLTFASQRRLLYGEIGRIALPAHAHNVYVNTLAEQGIVGLVAFFVFGTTAVAVIYTGSRSGTRIGRSICIGVGAGAMTWAARNIVDTELYAESSVLLLTLSGVAAAFVGLERVRARAVEEELVVAEAPVPAAG